MGHWGSQQPGPGTDQDPPMARARGYVIGWTGGLRSETRYRNMAAGEGTVPQSPRDDTENEGRALCAGQA